MILILDGPIAVGKSTLGAKWAAEFGGKLLLEPAHLLSNVHDTSGHNLFEQFYADMTRHAFAFQLAAYLARIKQMYELDSCPKTALYIVERSPDNTLDMFGELLAEEGHMSKSQQEFMLNQRLPLSPSGVGCRADLATIPDAGERLQCLKTLISAGELVSHQILKVCILESDQTIVSRFEAREGRASDEMKAYLCRLNAKYHTLKLCECKSPVGCPNWHTVSQGLACLQARSRTFWDTVSQGLACLQARSRTH